MNDIFHPKSTVEEEVPQLHSPPNTDPPRTSTPAPPIAMKGRKRKEKWKKKGKRLLKKKRMRRKKK